MFCNELRVWCFLLRDYILTTGFRDIDMLLTIYGQLIAGIMSMKRWIIGEEQELPHGDARISGD
jgi:hypothetical protein